jgi:hypothetical protein
MHRFCAVSTKYGKQPGFPHPVCHSRQANPTAILLKNKANVFGARSALVPRKILAAEALLPRALGFSGFKP